MTTASPHHALDPAYIAEQIETFSRLTEEGRGVTRPGYSALEREAHEHFAAQMRSFGLEVRTDAAGDTIAERPGSRADAAAIGTGSHLDSVPEGGRFDGVAGVVTAMAVARAMHLSGNGTERSWRFVAFAAEEGARFGQACNGSRSIAGTATARELDGFLDADGVSMAEAMRAVGLRPEAIAEAAWDPEDWHAFVELHIEQGGTLEEHGDDIGVVTVISGSTRLSVRIEGVASHSGATPMHLRKDALVAASDCVLAADAIAQESEDVRITMGRLLVHPGSITTIPGEVEFTVDIRATEEAAQLRTAAALERLFADISARHGTSSRTERIAHIAPQPLSEPVRLVTEEAAAELGLAFRRLPSGASHDSQQIALVAPTAMIFVPSRAGISHAPEEFSTTEQLHCGARLLLESLLRLDRVT